MHREQIRHDRHPPDLYLTALQSEVSGTSEIGFGSSASLSWSQGQHPGPEAHTVSIAQLCHWPGRVMSG